VRGASLCEGRVISYRSPGQLTKVLVDPAHPLSDDISLDDSILKGVVSTSACTYVQSITTRRADPRLTPCETRTASSAPKPVAAIMRRRYDGIALDVFLIALDVVVVAGVAGLAIGYWW
jgi:hypothetical protein